MSISLSAIRQERIVQGYGAADLGQFKASVRFFHQGMIEARLKRIPVLGQKVGFFERQKFAPGQEAIDVAPLANFVLGPIVLQFARLYEENLPGIKTTFGGDPHQWPGVVNFARIVRNSYFHRGIVEISNPNAGDAIWHHLVVGPRHNGFDLFGLGGLEVGDIIFLITEFSNTLDNHEVPIPA